MHAQIVDLTRLPLAVKASSTSASSSTAPSDDDCEYSSREISPPALLIQQLKSAHRIFCLHHGRSLSASLHKLTRDRFCAVLDRFWTRFCHDWQVLLHGNPAVDVFDGVKLAAGGELGMGVGEEEWGSGEREVLEDLIGQTSGLVDIVVSRFGEPADAEQSSASLDEMPMPWLGAKEAPEAPDGLIFGGKGTLSRSSLCDLSCWAQHLYAYGDNAYGVADNPQRQRRARLQTHAESYDSTSTAPQTQPVIARKSTGQGLKTEQQENIASPKPHATSARVPPPIVAAVQESLHKATENVQKNGDAQKPSSSAFSMPKSDKWVKYLTLGLVPTKESADPPQKVSRLQRTSTSSSNTLRGSPSKQTISAEGSTPDSPVKTMRTVEPIPDGDAFASFVKAQRHKEQNGYFLIGHRGESDADEDAESTVSHIADDEGERIVLRTIQVKISSQDDPETQTDKTSSKQATSSADTVYESEGYRRLRVLVYARRPFLYILLFEHQTGALQLTELYKSLHRHLILLHRPLLQSTSVAQVSRRIADSQIVLADDTISVRSNANTTQVPNTSAPVFDLVYDPMTLTVHTSIPNIPLPGTISAEGIGTTSTDKSIPPIWSRIEALNVHLQVLSTLASTQYVTGDIERTSKTTRGWWIVWLRVPPSSIHTDEMRNEADPSETSSERPEAAFEPSAKSRPEDCRIAFLVRKAGDGLPNLAASAARSSYGGSRISSAAGSIFGFGKRGVGDTDMQRQRQPSGTSLHAAGANSLGRGIGVDARRYVENLLSLNR